MVTEIKCQDQVNNTRSNLLFMGLLLGVAVGSIAALFLAPRPGREIRKRIVNQPKEALARVRYQINDIREKVKITQANMRRRGEEEASKVPVPK